MKSARTLIISTSCVLLSATLLCAADLSTYREFQFGANVLAVLKQTGMNPSDAKVVRQRPAVIQELVWNPRNSSGTAPGADPVKQVLLSFYNGELFQMVVNYDRYKTDGLTPEDMIEAISANYGTATKPDAEIAFPSIFNESVKVIARWEDAQYSFNLVRSSYQPIFGMVAFSKRLDALARTAIIEATRLDELEAPQREAARLKKQEEETRTQQQRARLGNKPSFRP